MGGDRHDGSPRDWRDTLPTALYVVLMVAVIVAVDLLFFKDRFWERLTANLGIVLVLAAFHFRFLRRL